MKRVCRIFILFVLSGALLSVMSCSDGEEKMSVGSEESVYDRMGRLHNEGLDYALDCIRLSVPTSKGGRENMLSVESVRSICREFAVSRGEEADVVVCVETWKDSVDIFLFPSGQQEWLRRIRAVILETPEGRMDLLICGMEELEGELDMDVFLSSDEKEMLFYVLAVCRYSAAYWAEHYEEWQVELHGVGSLAFPVSKTKDEWKYVTSEWWETYKSLVWTDGVGGIRPGDGGYYLEDATASSLQKVL